MKKKLNIALIDESFYPIVDGVANVVKNYALELSKRHNVTVFTTKPLIPVGIENWPFKIVRCDNVKHVSWDKYYSIPNPLDKVFLEALNQPFDIIHIHTPMLLGHLARKVAKKNHIPLVGTLHTQLDREILKQIKIKTVVKYSMKLYIAPCYNDCDELWVMNDGVCKLATQYGYRGKLFNIPNACDFYPKKLVPKTIESFRARYAKPQEHLLLYVGRLSLLKNIQFILRVCKELKAERFPFKLLIVGRGHDEDTLRDLVQELDIKDKVIFVGEVTNHHQLQHYYEIGELLLLPSFYDVASIVQIEAASVGLPTVFVEHSLTSYSVQNNVDGYVFPYNTKSFATHLVNVFKDNKQYQLVCSNVRRNIYKTWSKVVPLAEKRYYQVIKSHQEN